MADLYAFVRELRWGMPDLPTIQAPSSFAATATTLSVTLTWSSPFFELDRDDLDHHALLAAAEVGVYGQVIERCAGTICTNFTVVATVASNVETYTDSTVTTGLIYRYRIKAYTEYMTTGYTTLANPITVGTPPSGDDAVPDVLSTHPRLGFTDTAALRARLLDASYPERTMFTGWLADSYWTVNPYPAYDHEAAICNFSFLAALDPAALRADLGSSPGILADANYQTAAQCATKAYTLWANTLYPGKSVSIRTQLRTLPSANPLTAPTTATQQTLTTNDPRHGPQSAILATACLMDWAYAAMTPTQRADVLESIGIWNTNVLAKTRPWSDGVYSAFGNGPQWFAHGALMVIAALNETAWDGNTQRDAWARLRSWWWNSDRPSAQFHTFSDGTPAYGSTTPNEVRLDGRLGCELAEQWAVGSGPVETSWQNYAGDELHGLAALYAMSATAFVGTPPFANAPFASRWSEYLAAMLYPPMRSTSLPSGMVGYSVLTDAASNPMWASLEGSGLAPMNQMRLGALSKTLGHTSTLALGNYLTVTLMQFDRATITRRERWRYWSQGFLMTPHLDVTPAFSLPTEERHGRQRIVWTDSTSVDSPLVFVAPSAGGTNNGFAHQDQWGQYQVVCGGRLIVGQGNPADKGGYFRAEGTGATIAPEATYTGYGNYTGHLAFRAPVLSDVRLTNPQSPAQDPGGGTWLSDSPMTGVLSIDRPQRLVAYHRSSSLGYAVYNRAGKYAASFATAASLEFVYLRGLSPANVLIRYDRINRAADQMATFKPRLYIWVTANPSLSGASWVDPSGNGWYRYTTNTGAQVVVLNSGTVLNSTNQNTYCSEPATHARMVVSCLLPSTRAIYARGGYRTPLTGPADLFMYQMGTDETYNATPWLERISIAPGNYTASMAACSNDIDKALRIAGWGYLEVRDPADAANSRYLTAHEFGLSETFTGTTAVTAPTSVSAGWDMAHYRHATNEALVAFKTDADAAMSFDTSSLPLSYTWTKQATTTKHVICNVTKGGTFYVSCSATNDVVVSTSQGGTPVVASAGGILSFTTTDTTVGSWS